MLDRFRSRELSSEEKLKRDVEFSLAEASTILEMLEGEQWLDLSARHVLSRLLHVHGGSAAVSSEPSLPAVDKSIRLLEQKIFDVGKIQKLLEGGKTIEDLLDEERALLAQFTGNIDFRGGETTDESKDGSFVDVLKGKMEE